MAEQNRAQRTEKPTGKKLQDARREGNVPRSKELPSALVLLMFLVFCHVFGPDWVQKLRILLSYCLTEFPLNDLDSHEWLALVKTLGKTTASLLFLPVGLVAVGGVGGQLIQGPPPFTFKPLSPKLNKLNPISGLKKIFSRKSLVTLAKATLNMVLFTTVAILAVREAMRDGLPVAPGVDGTARAIFLIFNTVTFRVGLLWLVLAVADLLFQRHDHTRNLMMTKQEVKDERKELEGDPRIKAKIRSKQYEMARARMMVDVPKATVVVTNPTHIAIALRYVPGEMDVPEVVAKGRALLAERIRNIALEHKIPIIQDPPLARAIFRSVEVGGVVPVALYKAVAEVLALVMGHKRAKHSAARGVDR